MKLHQPPPQYIASTAIFGALWGLFELTAGTLLHAGRIPFRGVILACGATIILVTARQFLHYRGALILMGAVASGLKTVSLGGFVLTPILAIVIESVGAEIVFGLFRYHLPSALLTGGFILLYTFAHGLLAQGVFFGLEIYAVYARILGELFSWIRLNPDYVWIALLALAGLHLLLGMTAGFIGWLLAKRTKMYLTEEQL
ncbi:MAG: hypothetical protein WEE20_09045 [Bacteroidota bacterium]